MILLQLKPEAAVHREMMHRVMDHVVTEITEDQSGESWRGVTTKDNEKDSIKDKRERDADARWHDEPARIIRVIVMHAVQHKVETFSPAIFGFVVKCVSMNEVLEQRPTEKTDQKKSRDRAESKRAVPDREIDHVSDDWKIDHERHGGMNMGAEFEEIVLKHPHALVLV